MTLDIDEVSDIAIGFAKRKGYNYVKLVSIDYDEDELVWTVELDPMDPNINLITIEVDNKGKVISFETE